MAKCNSCGGILGIDCFNASDCASISRSNAEQDYLDMYELRLTVDMLKQTLIDHNIPIPELYKTQQDNNQYCFTDDFPF